MAEEKLKFTFLDDDGKPVEDDIKQEDETQGEESTTEDDANSDDEGGEDVVEGDGLSDSGDGESEEGDQVEPEEEPEEEEDEVEEDEEESDDYDEIEDEDEEDYDDSDDYDEDDVADYEELPEAVQRYLDFYEDTGGSFEDFFRINQDFTKLPHDQVIRDFIRSENPFFDDEDVDYEMERLFGYDPEVDSDRDIKQKTVAKKRYYGQAIKSLQAQQDQYKANLASGAAMSPEAQEAIQFRQQYEAQQQKASKEIEASRSSFVKKTDKLLGKEFKGFEVQLGEEKVLYKPENVKKVKEQNLNVNNLLNRFLDKKGNVSDVAGYHRALAVASDPEGFAQHFFELGKAAMAEEDAKDSKNVSMGPRKVQSKPKTKQPTFRFLDDDKSSKGPIKLKNY